jgi:hypothetical protein
MLRFFYIDEASVRWIFSEARRGSWQNESPMLPRRIILTAMEDALKKIIVVCGKEIEVFSLDGGLSWSSDLRQLRLREKLREREMRRQQRYARQIFKGAYLKTPIEGTSRRFVI